MTGKNDIELSSVVPVFDEEGSIKSLYEEINAAVNGKFEYEVIFVDDGSSDKSFDILSDISKSDNLVKVIRLRKNFGQTAALSA